MLFASVSLQAQVVDFDMNKDEGCEPLGGVNFTDKSSGGIVINRQWDLGNGTIVKNGNATVGANYPDAGTYTVKLTATFEDGKKKSIKKNVVVHPIPKVDFVADKRTGCSPFSVSFTDQSTTATGKITKWQWNFEGQSSQVQNPDITFKEGGDYSVSLVVTNSWGCKAKGEEKDKYIHVNKKPEVGFLLESSSLCEAPYESHFKNTTPGDFEYLWDFGDGNSSQEKNPTHTYSQPGKYSVSLTAQKQDGCDATYSTSVDIGKPMVAIKGLDVVCSGIKNTFSVEGSSGKEGQYQWEFDDDGTSETGKEVHHIFKNSGKYEVKLTTTNATGCSSIQKKKVSVKELPKADFTIHQKQHCSYPFEVEFNSQIISGSDLSYSWDFGDGSSSQEKNPTHIYQSGGPFSVQLIVKDKSLTNGCTSTTTKQVIGIQMPAVNIILEDEEGCTTFPVHAKALISQFNGPPDSLIWNWGDGEIDTVTNGNVEADHHYTEEGSFQLTLTMPTPDKCRITSQTRSVTVVGACEDDGSDYNDVGNHITKGGLGNFTVNKDCGNPYKVVLTDTVKNAKVLSWDFGDGQSVNSGSLNTVAHTFLGGQKEYTVTSTSEDIITGEKSTHVKKVIIIDEKANFEMSSQEVCRNDKMNFTTKGINPGNIQSYTWDFGDGTPSITLDNIAYYKENQEWLTGDVSHTYQKNGNYTVKLTIKDKLGCEDSYESTIPIKVMGPIAKFSSDNISDCKKEQEVHFHDLSAPYNSTPIEEWLWDFGDGNTQKVLQKNAEVTHTYHNNSFYNPYSVSLTVKDADGCEMTLEKEDLVKGYQPEANFTSKDTIVCGAHQVNFKNTSEVRGASFQWDFGDGVTSTDKNATHSYASLGTYDVKLKLIDEGGCEAAIDKPAFIKSIQPQADFEVKDIEDCAPTNITIENQSTYAQQWEWDFDDGSDVVTKENPLSHFYSKPGEYEISLKITGVNGCTDIVKKKIRIRGPIATITTFGNQGCKPFDFKAEVTGDYIDTYSWDFRDGTIVQPGKDKDEVTHTYTEAGKYYPNLIMTSPGGCTFVIKTQDPVWVDSLAADFVIQEDMFCSESEVIFKDKSVTPDFSGVTDWEWTFEDGTKSHQSAPPVRIYDPGDYTVSLKTKSQYGCIGQRSKSFKVQPPNPPTIDLNKNAEVCTHTKVYFNPMVHSQNEIEKYTWLLDGKPIGTERELNYTFESPGTYELTFSVKSASGCESTEKQTVLVHPSPKTLISSDEVLCEGNSVTLSIQGEHGDTYEWDANPDLQDFHAQSQVVTPKESTEYFVKTSNSFQCSTRDSVRVMVDKRINLRYAANQKICRGDAVELTVTGLADEFLWSPVNGLNQTTGKVVRASPTATTVYRVTGVSQNVCPDEKGEIKIEVLDVPSVEIVDDTTLVAGTQIKIHPVKTTGNIVDYRWTPAKGLSCSDCKQPLLTADKETTYQLKVTMDNGCSATDEMRVHVLCNQGAIYIPTAFTPNNDGENDVFYIHGYGIKKIKHFSIYNRWGQQVFENSNFNPGDPSQGWDGRVNNKVVSSTTTFVYKAEIECIEGKIFPIKGYVVLIQ